MILVLDPNVCLAASLGHPSSDGLLDDIWENRDYVKIALDKDENTILKDYERLLPHLNEKERKWLQTLLANRKHRTIELSAPKAHSQASFFDSEGCSTPVEPHLIALCVEPGRDARLLVVGRDFKHPQWRHRGTHNEGVVLKLQARFPELLISKAIHARRAITDYLRNKPLYPHTELELQEYLRMHKYEEGDQLEFKQPNPYFNRKLINSAMESICAMANSYGGKVLIGVDEDENNKGKLVGFVPRYKSNRGRIRDVTNDELGRIPVHQLREFNPSFTPDELRYHVIDLANGNKVMVFDVEKCSNNKRRYKEKLYYRHGTYDKEH
jgi:hypothetical protein